MSRRRIIFRKARAQSAARRIMFTTPAPYLVEDALHGHESDKPMTGQQFDLVAKALHDGAVSVEDAARARDAWVCFKPLPADLIGVVLAAGENAAAANGPSNPQNMVRGTPQ